MSYHIQYALVKAIQADRLEEARQARLAHSVEDAQKARWVTRTIKTLNRETSAPEPVACACATC